MTGPTARHRAACDERPVIDDDGAGVAATYRVARALSDDALRFTRVLADALDATIVAVEPSDRMAAERRG
jgi:hypothetical protein